MTTLKLEIDEARRRELAMRRLATLGPMKRRKSFWQRVKAFFGGRK